jgi:hypothetical protein
MAGWIEAAADGGSPCLFCGDRSRVFKPLDGGRMTRHRRLWWCQPCETTWAA